MPDLYNCWLDRKDTAVEMADFLAIDAYRTVQLTPISTRVNNLLHLDLDAPLKDPAEVAAIKPDPVWSEYPLC